MIIWARSRGALQMEERSIWHDDDLWYRKNWVETIDNDSVTIVRCGFHLPANHWLDRSWRRFRINDAFVHNELNHTFYRTSCGHVIDQRTGELCGRTYNYETQLAPWWRQVLLIFVEQCRDWSAAGKPEPTDGFFEPDAYDIWLQEQEALPRIPLGSPKPSARPLSVCWDGPTSPL